MWVKNRIRTSKYVGTVYAWPASGFRSERRVSDLRKDTDPDKAVSKLPITLGIPFCHAACSDLFFPILHCMSSALICWLEMANETFSAISQPGAFPGLGAQTSAWASYVVAALLLASLAYSRRDKYRGVPDVTPSRPFELTDSRKRKEFLAKSREILAQGSKRYGDQPYKVTAEMGQILVLPPQYVAELKNNPALDLTAFVQKVCIDCVVESTVLSCFLYFSFFFLSLSLCLSLSLSCLADLRTH